MLLKYPMFYARTPSMLDILQGTPLWVYAIYLWIGYYGIKPVWAGARTSVR